MKISRITFTVDDLQEGERIVAELLDRQWIACAQNTPVQSVYRWRGKLENASEWKFELKTLLHGTDAVVQFIHEKHSYEVPEILTEEVVSANPDFDRWIAEECAGLKK